jgi:hypothetical protein
VVAGVEGEDGTLGGRVGCASREHVFAKIKPTTNSRNDMGFALTHYKGKLPKRLIGTGGLAKKDRSTQRMEITAADQIDDQVKKWLKTAYDLGM